VHVNKLKLYNATYVLMCVSGVYFATHVCVC